MTGKKYDCTHCKSIQNVYDNKVFTEKAIFNGDESIKNWFAYLRFELVNQCMNEEPLLHYNGKLYVYESALVIFYIFY